MCCGIIDDIPGPLFMYVSELNLHLGITLWEYQEQNSPVNLDNYGVLLRFILALKEPYPGRPRVSKVQTLYIVEIRSVSMKS
jgi:hypothetical protein